MKKSVFAFLVFALIIVSACSKNPVQNEMPASGIDVKETDVITSPSEEQPQTTQETQQPKAEDVKEFKITAKNWEFSPAVIEVNKNDKVRLIVESVDAPHGIAIPDYGINKRLDPGQPVTIEFTADKSGEFVTFCSVACGSGHKNMKGKLIVH